MARCKDLGFAALLLAGTSLVLPEMAHADSDGPQTSADAPATTGISDIVVTARKREESAQKTPISVLLATGTALRDAGAGHLEDVTSKLPSIRVTEGALGDEIFIRGVGSGANSGFEQSVGTFIDGVYFGRGLQSRNSFLDIERVEVLRGPQSIYFGQNTDAGAINIATAKPKLGELSGYDLTAYEFGTRKVSSEGAINVPVSTDLALRVAGTIADQRGWQLNTSLGEHEPRGVQGAGRVSLLWEPDSTLSVLTRVQYEASHTTGLAAQAVGCPPPDGQPPAGYCLAYLNTPGANFNFGTTHNGGNGIGPIPSDQDDFDYLHSLSANITVKKDLPGGQQITLLSAYSGYKDRRSVSGMLLAGPYPAPGVPFDNAENVHETYDQFSQEIRITSPSGRPVEYIAGAYYQHDRLDIVDDFGAALFATRLSDQLQKDDTISGFASVTWHANDRLTFTSGLRYTNVSKGVERDQILAANQGNLDLAQAIPMTTSNPFYGLFTQVFGWKNGTIIDHRDDDAWLPSVNAQYNLAKGVMLYATYSKGFKAGGFDAENGQLNPATFSFAPEHVDSYEAGVKMDLFDRTMRLNISGFLSSLHDIQGQSFDGTLNFLVENTGKATSRGFEAEWIWELTHSLRLDFNGSYLDAYYTYFPNAQCTTAQFATLTGSPITHPAAGCSEQNGIFVQNLSGHPLNFSPKFSGNISLTHTLETQSGWKVGTTVGTHFETSYYDTPDDDPYLLNAGYAKLDASIHVFTPARNIELSVIGQNLTNKLTSHSANDLPLSAGSYYKFLDKPRTVAFQVRVVF